MTGNHDYSLQLLHHTSSCSDRVSPLHNLKSSWSKFEHNIGFEQQNKFGTVWTKSFFLLKVLSTNSMYFQKHTLRSTRTSYPSIFNSSNMYRCPSLHLCAPKTLIFVPNFRYGYNPMHQQLLKLPLF
jgi:hypothetical protein